MSWDRTVPTPAALLAGTIALLALTACGLGGSSSSGSTCPSNKLAVVAAENFWGSIAAQLGGDRTCVNSIIVNPDTDPHDYEAKPADARLIAGARYVIVNGAGYDPWAPKLLSANPAQGRTVLTVGDFVGKKAGDNPHMWYSPTYVDQVIDKITSDLESLDSRDASFFDQQKTRYKTVALKDYSDTIATIKQKYHGTPVGATESIFSYLAESLSLGLLTPSGYLKAISEGTDPTAADKAAVEQEIATRSIKVFVFNSQNSTPEVVSLVNKARAQNIRVVQITETLTPTNLSFQDWQTEQLKALLVALGG